jgi:hypothetical protein
VDPALFRIDFAVLAEVLITIIVLSFLVERALSLLFEHRLFVARFAARGVKEPIAFLTSLGVVAYWQFDAVGVILHADQASPWGYALTAGIIAGGSKASIKLFHDLMNVKSTAEKERSEKPLAAAASAVQGD